MTTKPIPDIRIVEDKSGRKKVVRVRRFKSVPDKIRSRKSKRVKVMGRTAT